MFARFPNKRLTLLLTDFSLRLHKAMCCRRLLGMSEKKHPSKNTPTFPQRSSRSGNTVMLFLDTRGARPTFSPKFTHHTTPANTEKARIHLIPKRKKESGIGDSVQFFFSILVGVKRIIDFDCAFYCGILLIRRGHRGGKLRL